MRGKIVAILCVASLTLGMIGCGSNGEESGQTSNQQEQKTEKGYAFEVDGVKVYVDMDMKELESKLGEPESYFEQPSCAVEGIAKIYTYSHFEIETYPDGDVDRVAYVVLKDDIVATPEGIDLSMTKEDIISVYGEDFEETENLMVYEKDGMMLRFILDGDYIVSIEYSSSVYF